MPANERHEPDTSTIEEPQAKRQKLDDDASVNKNVSADVTSRENPMDMEMQPDSITVTEAAAAEEVEISSASLVGTLLPPSRVLLGKPPSSHAQESSTGHTLEYDVGISEYISKDLPPIHAIIKQRQVFIYIYTMFIFVDDVL